MARLQILELPTIYRDEGPDETPYILVIDQVDDGTADDIARWPDNIAARTGARHVLCFSETVNIPANETPVDPDGYPLKIRVEGDFEKFREQAQGEIRKAQADVTRAMREAKQLPESRESTGRPTHPDGVPYNYSEITAGGWRHCSNCRTWGQWTTEKPHDCINTQAMNPATDA